LYRQTGNDFFRLYGYSAISTYIEENMMPARPQLFVSGFGGDNHTGPDQMQHD